MTNSVHEARQALGATLRGLRRDAGLSGRQLASLAGWHESVVSKIEIGDRSPTEAHLRAYCRHTGNDDQLPDHLPPPTSTSPLWPVDPDRIGNHDDRSSATRCLTTVSRSCSSPNLHSWLTRFPQMTLHRLDFRCDRVC
ncbi:helix-turn-helix domain-containing protein [Nocardia sputorum]|uniref:helix-turn-helix domain-containing protein n=1 Tax=Nocardia sputorum TaxID=2984338 RepID=UPI003D9CBC7B